MQGFIHIHQNQPEAVVRASLQQSKAPQMQLISTPAPHQFPSSGTKFIKTYVIDYTRKIGQGNFSTVYNAIDQRQPNQRLAVKVVNIQLLRQQNLEFLVKSEVQVLLFMRHENIIFCKDVCYEEGFCYIFTEFCEGGSLENKIKKAQTRPIQMLQHGYEKIQSPLLINPNGFQIPNITQAQMLPYIRDIFQGMLYLERSHIIHRDIKAANIFIKQNRAIVADFGFAKFFNEPFTDLNIGSLPYMPPQSIAQSYYSVKTDVWAFGVTVFQLFHGESPYAKSVDLKDLIHKTCSPLNVSIFRTDISIEMKQLILNCLQPDMEKRKRFSELQKMWYARKLFDTTGQYKNLGNRGIDSPLSPARQFLNVQRGRIGNQRTFGSRFKQKINIGNGAKIMNYNDQNPMLLTPTMKINLNSPNSLNLNQNYLMPNMQINSPLMSPHLGTKRGVSPNNVHNMPSRSVGKPGDSHQQYQAQSLNLNIGQNQNQNQNQIVVKDQLINSVNGSGITDTIVKPNSNVNSNTNNNTSNNSNANSHLIILNNQNNLGPTTITIPTGNTQLIQSSNQSQNQNQNQNITNLNSHQNTSPSTSPPTNTNTSPNPTPTSTTNPTNPTTTTSNQAINPKTNLAGMKYLNSLNVIRNQVYQSSKQSFDGSPINQKSGQRENQKFSQGQAQGQGPTSTQIKSAQLKSNTSHTILHGPTAHTPTIQVTGSSQNNYQSQNNQNTQTNQANTPRLNTYLSTGYQGSKNNSLTVDALVKTKSVGDASPTVKPQIKNILNDIKQQKQKQVQKQKKALTNTSTTNKNPKPDQHPSQLQKFSSAPNPSTNPQKKSQDKPKPKQPSPRVSPNPSTLTPPTTTTTTTTTTTNPPPQTTPNIQAEKLSQLSKEREIACFKDVLLSLQEIRNYYKLAVNLKDHNKRVSEIKNRLLMKAVKEITKLEALVKETDKVDISTYDRSSQNFVGSQRKEDAEQRKKNVMNRRNKLLEIIKDYKLQFQNQLRRRQISPQSIDWLHMSQSSSTLSHTSNPSTPNQKPQQTPATEQKSPKTPQFLPKTHSFQPAGSVRSPTSAMHKFTENFKQKSYTLSQDIEYIVQTELAYTVEDTPYMTAEESLRYRNKLKDILEDIMHVQHGFLSSMHSKNMDHRVSVGYGTPTVTKQYKPTITPSQPPTYTKLSPSSATTTPKPPTPTNPSTLNPPTQPHPTKSSPNTSGYSTPGPSFLSAGTISTGPSTSNTGNYPTVNMNMNVNAHLSPTLNHNYGAGNVNLEEMDQLSRLKWKMRNGLT